MFDDLRTLFLAAVLLWITVWAPTIGAARLRGGNAAPSLPIIASLPEELPSIPMPNLPDVGFTTPTLPLSRERESGPARLVEVPDIILNARAAFAETSAGQELFAQNADDVLPIASITKLLSALVAFDRLPLDAAIPVSLNAVRAGGDSAGLVAGESLSFHDALLAMLLESSNDAAVAVAEAAGGTPSFLAAMTEKASAIDLGESRFFTPHGLPPPSNAASARGVAKLLRETLGNPTLFEILRQQEVAVVSLDGRRHVFRNTNALLPHVPGIIGGKTGYTEESLGTLAIAFSPRAAAEGRPASAEDPFVVLVVLGSTDRFVDTEALARWVLAAYDWN